ncbi:MAG TPA: isochorismate synthase [Propionibacterium sp.]|nr:isochorismate synthase [Propionibacterium sp.]
MTGGPDAVRVTEPFATSLRRGTPLVWATGAGDDLTALLGWGEAFRATAQGPGRFAELDAAFSAWVATLPSGSNPVAYATVAFADDSAAHSVLIVPELVGRWAHGVLTVEPTPGTASAATLPDPTSPCEFDELDLLPGRLTRQRYRNAVAAAIERIRSGEVEKVVIARDLVATSPEPLDLSALLARLQASNTASWTFHVDGMVGSSPEMLVATRGTRVRSQVLAGSAPVTGDVHLDDVTATRLAASAKDHTEHVYAARSVAERLASVADVTTRDPQVIRLPRIMHLATDIGGTLRGPHSPLALAGIVHPSAAVCGTPTEVAFDVIAELEGFDRGRYAGPVGWLDARGDGEFVIALRCGQVDPDGTSIRLFAGGGIVTGSVPTDELAETARKFLPMYEALSPVDRP